MDDLHEDLKALTRQIVKDLEQFEEILICDEAYVEGKREVLELLVDLVVRYE